MGQQALPVFVGHRLTAWRRKRPHCSEAHATGSPSSGQGQIASPPRQLNPLSIAGKGKRANPSKAGAPSTPTSFTSTDHESQSAVAGNPRRFRLIEVRHLEEPSDVGMMEA